MLVRIEDTKGAETWINPLHVKIIKQSRKTTEIVLALSSSWGNSVIKTTLPADEVALMMNAAMPEGVHYLPDDEPDQDGGAAAIVAAG